MPSKKKLLAAAALTASLAGGGVVGAMFGTPVVSSAQTAPDEGVERAERPSEGRSPSGEVAPAERPAQAGEERRVGGRGHEGRPSHDARRLALEAAAEALGMSAEELKAELRSGKSVRSVAEERGVAVQSVIDAIVATITEHAEERATEFVNRQRPAEDSPRDN